MPDRSARHISRRTLALAAFALSSTIAVGRHATAKQTPDPSPDASPPGTTPSLLLRMEAFGGTQPAELQLIAVPEFSLYDDGTIYRLGPTIAIFPPAALPNLTRMRVSRSAVDAIMSEARTAGLEEPRRVPDQPMSEEIPAHRFFFNNGDKLVESLAWGLTIDAVQAPDWGEEALAQHQALRSLAAYLINIPFNLPAEDLLEQEVPIDPDRLQVISFEPTPSLVLPSGVPNLEQPTIEWPLDTPLAEASVPFDPSTTADLPTLGCFEIAGADAAAVVSTSRTGDLLSPWTDGGVTYGLLLKPLLPDQAGCVPMRDI